MNLLDLLYIPVAGLTAPWWATKHRSGWNERFGYVTPLPPQTHKPRLLIHAVSVGEVSALRRLVSLLDDVDLVISATTDSGLARAKDLFGTQATIVRYPLDFSWSVCSFLNSVRPHAVALVELELWPNFVRACSQRNIPVAVINGRLSARSFRGYRRIRPLIKHSFASLALAAVQDHTYAARFQTMGVPPDKCVVSGTMKWDAAVLQNDVPGAGELAWELGIDRSRPLIVAGSTGPLPGRDAPAGFNGRHGRSEWCEEALFHMSCPPGTQLLCAPRKPERFEDAAAALPGCVRRSVRKKGCGPGGPAERFLLDSIGELRAAYSLADLAIIGRSFGALHGSDPVEPVSLGKATVMGPAAGDFEQSVGALEAGGGLIRTDAANLRQCLTDLMSDAPRRQAIGKAGRAVICEHQGASDRHAELLRKLLEVPKDAK
jgi:3-deoxy-D-manno-octulosonic-acid transferase